MKLHFFFVILILFFTLFLHVFTPVKCQTITTIAGSLPYGYNGDNQLATQAELYGPRQLAFHNNELYITDSVNSMIRKILSNGTIVSVAGWMASRGFNGDNQLATLAVLNSPYGVAVSQATGHIYIAGIQGSGGNGGLAIYAELYFPYSLTIRNIEGVGDEIYIADSTIIRKIGTDGKITRYAGGGTQTAEYISALSTQLPSSMVIGISQSTGELYIGMSGDILVRKVFTNGTIVSIVKKDNSLVDTITALTVSNSSVYYTESNRRVLQYSIENGTTTVIGGSLDIFNSNFQDNILATTATLQNTRGIAVSETGDVYFSESSEFYSNGRVRKIKPDGYIVTTAGNMLDLNSGYNGDNILAVNAKLKSPESVVVSNSGEVYISDTGNSRIRKILSNGQIVTVVGRGNFRNSPSYNGDYILAINANIKNPSGILLSSTNELYIADTENYRIRKVLTNGTIVTIAGTGSYTEDTFVDLATNIGIGQPKALALFGNEIYFSTKSHRVKKILSNGTLITYAGTGIYGYDPGDVLAVNTKLFFPNGLDVYPNGDLLIADSSNHVIRKVLTNGTVIRVAGTGTRAYNGDNILAVNAHLSEPSGIHILSNGEILFSDKYNYRVRKILTNGTIITIAGIGTYGYNGENLPALSTKFFGVTGLALSPVDGSIYLADTSNHRIRKITDPCDVSRSCYNNGVCNSTNNQYYPTDSFLSTSKVSSIVSSSSKSLNPTNSASTFSLLKDRYQIQEVIGKGSFGKCYLCVDVKKQNQPVAIKTISIEENKHSKIIDECSKTVSYKHPRLVQVYEFFESELLNSICIVMKFYNGDLETLLKKQENALPESVIIKMMKQLGDGLDYLHNEKLIIHRDIKPKNIFIESFDIEKEEINIVIGDYGEAKDLGETSNSVVGTLLYMAPEVFSRKYDYSVDIFSLGVTLVQSMSASGFDFSVTDKLMYEAEESVLKRVSEHLLSRQYSTQLCEFVIAMLSRDPNKRPTCVDIKNY
ncbi:predicted protein [Naegleria gruberi]|uniref:non-specific serine/threonine protein kinase n=1 Tax=Naegleria gruberi TaxID=5762 RepID=D2VC48_NAEGR|nr:uncharacterized protein NAEGRDRAFT_48346 [Naegleria gruberi]EFC45685.1 predicted protein [Naegleria gruberi]|eukprot:XP_002678429.1 predicted protein [Naegleria gruberi strain NEG-M]